MSLFLGKDFKHYMSYSVSKEDKEKMAIVSGVTIDHIRVDDIVEHIYELLDPKNDLHNFTVKIAFDALPEENKMFLATSMFIYRYCIHRVLTLFKIYDIDNWQYHLTDDYYAQEVTSITLKTEIAHKLDITLRHMSTFADNKKIEYILKLEFNRVLPEAYNRTWHIATVEHSSLYFSNMKLYNKCLESDLQYLKDYKLPRGLCIMESINGKSYRVIDGYHRLAGVEKDKKKHCLVIYT